MPKIFRIKNAEQLEAIALPIRTDIMECVAFLGPCSAKEIAEVTHQKRPAIHFHVKKLMEVGILQEAGTRGSGRQEETLYKTLGSLPAVVYDADDPRNVELTIRYVKNLLARTQRLLGRGFQSGNARTSGPLRDTGAVQLTAWLSEDELSEVNRLIGLLVDQMKPTRPREGKRLINLTLAFAPIHPEDGNSS